MNENNFSLKILYPAKLSLKVDGGIKSFHDEQKLKQYMTTTTGDSTKNSAHRRLKQTKS
jgi:hypothetical protein